MLPELLKHLLLLKSEQIRLTQATAIGWMPAHIPCTYVFVPHPSLISGSTWNPLLLCPTIDTGVSLVLTLEEIQFHLPEPFQYNCL